MIPVLTKQQAYQVDKETIDRGHLSQEKLTDNAGKAVADFFLKNIKDPAKQKVLILCGKGNNGADGIVAHYYLRKNKINSFIQLCEENVHKDLLKQYKISKNDYLEYNFDIDCEDYTWIIDGIFGIGFSRELTKKYSELINLINKNTNIISIDMPSGLSVDSSKKFNTFIKAKHTVTFGSPKLGHYLNCLDNIYTKDIGLKSSINIIPNNCYNLIDINDAVDILKPYINKKEIHKYTKGEVDIHGGSINYPGAAILAAQSALKSGAGYVNLYIYRDNNPGWQNHLCVQDNEEFYNELYYKEFYSLISSIKSLYPNIIVHTSRLDIEREQPQADNLLFGPGIDTQSLYFSLDKIKNCVVDAGGFRLFPNISDYFYDKTILTPHMGEFKKIFHLDDDFELNDSLISKIQDQIKDKIIILKSFNTFIITKDTVYIMDKGPSLLAVAGTGDVLSGILISLLSQGYNRTEASILGTYLHAESANYYRDNISKDGMTASDLIDCIPFAYNKLRGLKESDG